MGVDSVGGGESRGTRMDDYEMRVGAAVGRLTEVCACKPSIVAIAIEINAALLRGCASIR